MDYYEGRSTKLNCSSHELDRALAYCNRHKRDYTEEVVEKLKIAKVTVTQGT